MCGRKLIEAAQIVESARVVSVRVSEEHRVDPVQTDGQGLQAELRGRIDQHNVIIESHDSRRASAAVAHIVRSADGALAPDDRDAVRGAGAEKRDLSHEERRTPLTIYE